MNGNVFEFKKKKADRKKKEMGTKRLIAPDLPFDYEELVEATSEEYVRNLNRDGMSFLSYEEIKRNIDSFLLRALKKPEYTNVSGFQVADNYYYHTGHSWAHIEDDGHIKVGLDDFTSKVLGTADAINLPPKGVFLRQGEIGCVLTRNDKKAPMQSPVSGTVCAVNDKVLKQPAVAHDDPYHDGWLFMLDPANIKPDLEGLYSGKECFQWMEKESQNLHELLGPSYKQLAATGGEPIDDIFGHFPEISWDRLVRTFFRTAEKR